MPSHECGETRAHIATAGLMRVLQAKPSVTMVTMMGLLEKRKVRMVLLVAILIAKRAAPTIQCYRRPHRSLPALTLKYCRGLQHDHESVCYDRRPGLRGLRNRNLKILRGRVG